MTTEDLQYMLNEYQQNLANAQLQLAAANAKVTRLEREAEAQAENSATEE